METVSVRSVQQSSKSWSHTPMTLAMAVSEIETAEPETSSLLFHMLFFTTWRLHYPQYNQTADSTSTGCGVLC